MRDDDMTARLAPGAGRGRCAAAVLQRARISRVLNEAPVITPTGPGVHGVAVATTSDAAQESFDGDRS
jgi:hypothetical protein